MKVWLYLGLIFLDLESNIMFYTFTHDELFNSRFNASTIIVLAVLKTLINEKEIVCNNDLFERLPISEKTIFRCIKTLKEQGIILDKKGKRKSKMKPSKIKNEKMKLIYELSFTMKHQEIADKLEMSRSTVTDNISRYRLKLINDKKKQAIEEMEVKGIFNDK